MNLFKWPTIKDWGIAAQIGLGFSMLAIPLAMATGLFQWQPVLDGPDVLRTALIALILPAFLEELVFRGPLLWLQNERGSVPLWIVLIALIVFVAWHPINAFTFMPQAADVFLDWRFLCVAGLLGAFATWMTLRLHSLWPAIVFHWLVVVLWKAFFGAPGFL